LDEACKQWPESDYIFLTKTGLTFREGSFRQNYWYKDLDKAGFERKTPYSIRHTFAGWVLAINIDKNRLEKLMGHKNKKMVYEIYAECRDGLKEDREKILSYLGKDFL